jgi:hypothetical protein
LCCVKRIHKRDCRLIWLHSPLSNQLGTGKLFPRHRGKKEIERANVASRGRREGELVLDPNKTTEKTMGLIISSLYAVLSPYS